jgi:hypothetical protein
MLETKIEPDLSPLLDPFKTITNPHQDGWLEADFEDRISGILE